MDPINYGGAFTGLQSPNEAFLQGAQGGAGIAQLQAQQSQAQLAAQQKAQMQADLSALAQNPTTQAIGAMSVKYPQLSEQFKRSFDMLDSTQKQSKLDHAAQVYAALHNGEPKIAQQLLSDQATALRNSGNENDAKAAETMASLIDAHPQFAQTTAGLMISSAMGPDKFAAAFPAIGGEQRAQEQAPAELAKKRAEARKAGADASVAEGTVPALIAAPELKNKEVEDQIADRAKRFALDQDKFTTETQIKLTELKNKFGELPEYIAKDQATAVTSSIAAQQSADKMNGLAEQLEKEGGGYGAFSTAGEWLKKVTGNQNEMTRIRAEYKRIVTPAAMEAYKKNATGSTSDKDIETALLGVPGDSADSNVMAAFLRGTAKLQRYESVLQNAKSEWLGEVKGLGKAKGDIEVDGIKVASGTTFKQFTDAYVDKKIKQLSAGDISKRPYMKYAAPAPPMAPQLVDPTRQGD